MPGELILPYDRKVVPQEKPWDCGPASTQVVLSALGIEATEAALISEVGTTVNGTDYVGLIEKVLDRRAPQAKYTSVYMPNDPPTAAQRDRLWADVSSSLQAGFGVVMNWVAPPTNHPRGVKGSQSPNYGGGTIWHYVACMGIDFEERAFWIADPGFAPFGYWVSFDQCASLIPPKGYCYAAAPAGQVAVAPAGQVQPASRPDFNEYAVPCGNSQDRRGTKVDLFVLHTEEGGSVKGGADRLARWFRSGPQVSYHYTVSQDPDDHGVTVCDVVPVERAAWSCLSANNRSVNLCFAGSRAAWTTEQWMEQSKAIDAAAFIAVRDCRRFGIPLTVIAPPAYGPPGGITDHAYVTRVLRDGTHTDVGPGFPWKWFAERVAFWSGGKKSPEQPARPVVPRLRPVGPADDQLTLRWNCLGGQTLVEAVAEVRDKVCGTADRAKSGIRRG